MNPKHLHILQHSLGCDKYGNGTQYRNHYAVGPGQDSFSECRELCEIGLMEDHGPQSVAGGMHCFTVSEKGKRQMKENSPQAPKISPGRRRYLDFLEADSGLSFIKWLRMSKR